MVEWVGLSNQPPDFANALARVMQIRAAQQQGEAAQAEIEGNNRLAALINPEFAARLAQNDPAAIAAIAATGSRGLNLALPLMHQARQPNQTRQVEIGGSTVTQEYDPATRTWREIARGPRWQPQQAQAPVAVIGPDGRPTLVSPAQAYGRQPYIPTENRPQVVAPGAALVGPTGQPVFTNPERPQQAPSGYVWGAPDANGNPTLVPIPGGPAEFITQQVQMPDGTIGLVQIPRAGASTAERAPVAQGSPPDGPPMSRAPWAGAPAAPPSAGGSVPAQRTPEELGLPPGSRILSSGPGRQAGLTEAQAKANLFGLQMQEADQTLGTTSIPNNFTLMVWRNAPEAVTNLGLSANDQKYFNAVRLFAAGILRKETGAAFTNSELLDVQSRFFPMPGDSPAVIEQKARARQTAIHGIQAELPGQQFRRVGITGPGGQGTAEPPPASAAPRGRTTPPPPPGFELVR